MKRETALFFDSIVRDDHNVLDLLTADYTYVNQDLAAFYGIPGVAGPQFRKVSLQGTHRRGILGEGAILVETSVADRSDPVLRGKWVLEVLLGQPPPPPPPGVNTNLDDTASAVQNGKTLSVRERMAQHRANPFCASCHSVIDPIGLSLENFDPSGHWRIKDNDVPVDAATTLYDGTKMSGLDGLKQAILKHQDTFLRVFTENLMAYALGRQVEDFDMPVVRVIVSHRGAARQPVLLVRPRHRAQRCVPDEPGRRAEREYRCGTSAVRTQVARTFQARVTALGGGGGAPPEGGGQMFITQKHISRRTVLKGAGVTLALPSLEATAPAGQAWAATTTGKLAGRTRFVAMEMVHGAAGCADLGVKQHLWSPVGHRQRLRPVAHRR